MAFLPPSMAKSRKPGVGLSNRLDNSISKQKVWSTIVNYINLLNLFYATGSVHRSQVVGIIRDSETDATATFQSIQSVLRNNGLGVPPKRSKFLDGVGENPAIGVFLTPDNTSNSGKLEDLFVATNREHPAIHCVDNYMECLENSLQRKTSDDAKGCQYLPKNMSKARARTLLAAMYYDVKDLGNAAKCGCWNMEHNCLNDLKDPGYALVSGISIYCGSAFALVRA